ncbi:hypothetical protein CD122_10125 [Staphylococcus rostri]|uniref:GIY-YIG domain-containing protein n=1 Tax=Staphylococcus rostri TaxID=522262 RepID=A0A2K3YI86_9STAP|nr:DUF2075 domain-containing protein [Staphylococcus rostri]PNZ25312.1 hypothetical protein CD122_10125 [Staphylococcus rostri]
MASYSCFELEIDEKHILNIDSLNRNQRNALDDKNVIYIYKSDTTKQVYIGQTKHFNDRHKQHYNGAEEKFNNANFNKVMILISRYFNLSALDDVESQLITYFLADRKSSRKKYIDYDESHVINLTAGNYVNAYKEKEDVESKVLLPFWEKVLYPDWVKTPSIDELRTKSLVKYSPIKVLNDEQNELIQDIIDNPNKSYVINGNAGTGKTVLLTHTIARLLKETNNRVAIVVQPNWIDTAKEIFKVFGLNNSNLSILSSTQLINHYSEEPNQFDVVIVDESHKLSRNYSKQHPSFNSVYKDEFTDCHHHLECIQKIGKQIILMYDVLQGIRPANITRDQFAQATRDYEYKYLTTQFRIQAPKGKSYTSEDYINGIKYLLYKDTGLLDKTRFNPNFDRDVFKDTSEDAYFGYFDEKPLQNLIDWIDEDRNYNPDHINRILGGLVEKWKQADGKDASITHWHEGDIKRRWNATQENWVNSKDKDAEDQIGSVFAVQGIDLNKVGVLIGNDLQVDAEGKLYAEKSNFHNVNGKFPEQDQTPETDFEFTLFVLNIYYVLLTRGIDGIRLGFWKNDAFMHYLEETLEIK